MKAVTVLVLVILAALGGAFVFKRLAAGGELPVEGVDTGVPLAPVPPMREAP